MEGKETRFGIPASALFASVTTAASCGAVNAMHDSLSPLGGLVPMLLMQLGEVVFGGVGSGLYGMLIFAMLAVFIAGLMIGRTPEYLGKKIGVFEMKMMSIAILVTPALVLIFTAIAVMVEAGLAGIANPGRTVSRNPLRLQLGRQQQRQRLRRALGQHAVLQHHHWPACGWAASASSCRCWPWPVRWPARSAWPPPPAPCPRTARCSWRC
jgi:K+-transporting ATPase ATPase A chain